MQIQHPKNNSQLICDCGGTSFCHPYDAHYLESGVWAWVRCNECRREIKVIHIKDHNYSTSKSASNTTIFTVNDWRTFINNYGKPKQSLSLLYLSLPAEKEVEQKPVEVIHKKSFWNKLINR